MIHFRIMDRNKIKFIVPQKIVIEILEEWFVRLTKMVREIGFNLQDGGVLEQQHEMFLKTMPLCGLVVYGRDRGCPCRQNKKDKG